MNIEEKFLPHPAADIFPEMPQEEFEKLKDDIAENGLHQDIVLYEGQILDGRHRYRACQEIGLTPSFEYHDGDDPFGYVVSANLRRRHLNESQRAMVAAQIANNPRGGNRSKAQICGLTHEQAAEQLNISPRLVDKASALFNAANDGRVEPGVVDAVRAGEMTLERAAKISRSTKRQKENLSRKGACRPRQHWARSFEKIASQAEHLCFQIQDVCGRTREADQLTPERRNRLVKVGRQVALLFTKVVQDLESMPQEGPDEMPSDKTLDRDGGPFSPQAFGTHGGVGHSSDEVKGDVCLD